MCDLSPTVNNVANLNQAGTKCLLTAANCCHVTPTAWMFCACTPQPPLHHVLTALIQWASSGPLRFSGIEPVWESSIFNFHFPPGSIFHHFHPYVGVGVPPLPFSLSFAFTYLYLTLNDLPLHYPSLLHRFPTLLFTFFPICYPLGSLQAQLQSNSSFWPSVTTLFSYKYLLSDSLRVEENASQIAAWD